MFELTTQGIDDNAQYQYVRCLKYPTSDTYTNVIAPSSELDSAEMLRWLTDNFHTVELSTNTLPGYRLYRAIRV